MNNKSEITMNNTSIIGNIISWLFGIVFFAIGVINTFWGNDPGFGVFILLLSFVYFLPVNTILKKMAGFSISGMGIVKIVLGIFIVWAALGVGELYDKIELMKMDYNTPSITFIARVETRKENCLGSLFGCLLTSAEIIKENRMQVKITTLSIIRTARSLRYTQGHCRSTGTLFPRVSHYKCKINS
jgi:hypothetical protein